MNKIIRKKILIILGAILCFTECRDNSIKRKDIHDNGKLKQTVIFISDTTFYNIEYYDNGGYSSIATFHSRSMMKDGLYISFYESGIVAEKGFFRKNKKQGEWCRYSREGLLEEKYQFVELYSDEDQVIKENIYYDEYMEIDTTKQLLYVEAKSFSDTIYEKEPYLFKVRLYKPYFKEGSMEISFVNNHSDYYDLSEVEFENPISCVGFKHLFQVRDYQIGHNDINAIVINYDETGKLRVPYYFSKSFYVKELPK